MSLERVETLCLNYLKQSENPLVSVEALYLHCEREQQSLLLDRTQFTEFLNKHAEVVLLPGAEEQDPVGKELFREAGIDMGARAVFHKRVPSQETLAASLAQQLETMKRVLTEARDQALQAKDQTKVSAMNGMLSKTEALFAKMKKFV